MKAPGTLQRPAVPRLPHVPAELKGNLPVLRVFVHDVGEQAIQDASRSRAVSHLCTPLWCSTFNSRGFNLPRTLALSFILPLLARGLGFSHRI